MLKIVEILEQIRQTSSTNEKLDILREHQENKLLEEILKATYDPFIVYGIKKSISYEFNPHGKSIEEFTDGSGVSPILGFLTSKIYTGNKAISYISNILEGLSELDAEYFMKMIQKDLKCGLSASTINKVWPKLIPVFPVMKAGKFDEKNKKHITFPAIIQLKHDGMRCAIMKENGKISFFSSSGKDIPITTEKLLKEIREYMPNNSVIDGELVCYVGNTVLPRKTSNGICNKIMKGGATKEDESKLRFCAWDIITLNEFRNEYSDTLYQHRFNMLTDITNNIMDGSLVITESRHIFSWEEALEITKDYIDSGKEGSIVKNIEGVWENKRSKGQIKLKNVKDADLKIVGFTEGTGRFVGSLGSILLETSCGKLTVGVGTGLSDKDREEIWSNKDNIIGNIVEITYNEIIESKSSETKSMFITVFVSIREDKIEANSLQELLK